MNHSEMVKSFISTRRNGLPSLRSSSLCANNTSMHARVLLTFLVVLLMGALLHPWGTGSYANYIPRQAVQAQTAAATAATLIPAPPAEKLPTTAPSQNVEESTTVLVEETMYTTPPLSFETVNTQARSALVNILCTATGNDLNPVSGSGVIIDGKGTVLTNAHIGQYILLQDSSPIAMECFVRTGSPAKTQWKPRLLYISETWLTQHAKDIRIARPTGTGEYDFALIALEPIDTPLSLPLPYIEPDTRDGVILTEEKALAASYPAGFAGAITIYNELSLISTISTIKRLYTFSDQTIDLLSLGGVIVAQQGSSGGALVNAWGRLVGLIVTSSDAKTTAERDLRALTLAHIDRILIQETGSNLSYHLSSDPRTGAALYREAKGRMLAALLTTAVLQGI